MQIERNSVVRIHYHLTRTDGAVLDSSQGQEPLGYLHGHDYLVPGVERALTGQEAGAEIDVEVAPADGYGEHDPALDLSIPLSAFPTEMHASLKPGARFQGPHPAHPDREALYTVTALAGSEVVCTANHPLAGVTLHFKLEVIEVREATTVELSQGRFLAPGQNPQSGCCSNPDCDK
jgi:FKBP-type peptidyl-prolyl cis-trans isomerase SlyD